MRRSSKKLPKDPNQLAHEIVRISTEESEEAIPIIKDQPKEERSPISQYLAEIGRRGGIIGGRVRAERLSKKKRSEIARSAAQARWGKKEN